MYLKAALCIRPLKTGAVTVWPDKISSDSLLAEWLQWQSRIVRLLSSAAPLDSKWAGAADHHQYPGNGFLRRRRIRLEYCCLSPNTSSARTFTTTHRKCRRASGRTRAFSADCSDQTRKAQDRMWRLRINFGKWCSWQLSTFAPPRRVLGSGCSQFFSDATGTAGSARAWSRLRTCRSAFAEVV